MLTAGGTYVEDVALPGAAWLTYVRSPIAHARITGIDVAEAAGAARRARRAHRRRPRPSSGLAPERHTQRSRRPCAGRSWPSDVVRYVGQPVVAVDRRGPRHRRRRRRPRLRRLRAAARRGRSRGGGRATRCCSSPRSAPTSCSASPRRRTADFSDCEVVVAERIVNQRHDGGARSSPARAPPTGPTTAASCTTRPARAPTRPATCWPTIYGLDPAQVRVIVPDVGGGFGAKSRTYPEELALGFYARRRGPPGEVDRDPLREHGGHAPRAGPRCSTPASAARRDGRITAYQLDVVQDVGRLPAHRRRAAEHDPAHDDRRVRPRQRRVHRRLGRHQRRRRPRPTAGPGRPEAAVAIERMVDRFAAEIGMDPAEVRRRNLVPRFFAPYTTGIGTDYDVGDYPEALERVLRGRRLRRAAGRAGARGGRPATRSPSASGSPCTSRSPPARPGTEFGAVELLDGGRLLVRTGATPYGQGHDTTWAMIVADRTGVPIDRHRGASTATPTLVRSGGLTVGSRSVQLGGAAIADATGQAGRRWPASGPPTCSRRPSTTSCSTTRPAASTWPARRPATSAGPSSWAAATATDAARRPSTDCRRRRCRRSRSAPTWPWSRSTPRPATCGCAGSWPSTTPARILNPLLAEGQVHGGIAQGVAQALLEEIHYDDDGQPRTTNFADYAGDLGRRAAVVRASCTWRRPPS